MVRPFFLFLGLQIWRLRDDSRKNQFLPGRFAQNHLFRTGRFTTICKKLNKMCSFQKSIFLVDCEYHSVDIIAYIYWKSFFFYIKGVIFYLIKNSMGQLTQRIVRTIVKKMQHRQKDHNMFLTWVQMIKVMRKQWTGTRAIRRQIPPSKQKWETTKITNSLGLN